MCEAKICVFNMRILLNVSHIKSHSGGAAALPQQCLQPRVRVKCEGEGEDLGLGLGWGLG